MVQQGTSGVPEEVLDSRMVQRGNSRVPQVLVRWTDQPAEFATWEDRIELQQHFPNAPAWGQAVSEGGRDVTAHGPQAPAAEDQDDTATTKATGLERPRRQAQPNKRYTGPEWNTSK